MSKESRDWRKKQDEMARELQRKRAKQAQEKRDAAIERSLWAEAEQEKQLKRQDDKWEQEMLRALGGSPEALESELKKVDPALARKVGEIKKQKNKGKFKKAMRLAKKDKARFKDAKKKKKRGK